ncbi:MAG: site-specific integrase [Nitrospiraceae bacterium]|nr:site-specific integrase [Nitrospiraceae bacterium]
MGLTKRKDSYYVAFSVMVADDGKTLKLAPGVPGAKLKRWKVGCLNKGIAKEMEATIRTNLLQGKVLTDEARPVLFSQWAKEYLSLEEVQRLRSFSTRAIHVSHLLRFFSNRALTAITCEDVRRYRAWRAGHGVSIQTVNHDHMTLTRMLNVAMSDQFNLVSRNVSAAVPKPDPKNERDRIVTPEEWAAIRDHAAPHLKRFLTVAYDLGARRGELLRLEWPDVDMKRKEFTLRETKNGEARTVPMTPEVHEAFRECWKERRLDTPRVFLYKGRPIECRLTTAFKAACRRAGVVYGRKNGGITAHDFRHSAATTLRRAGVDTMTAMKIIGHKSEKMHRRYNQISPADLHHAVGKLVTYHATTAEQSSDVDTVMTPSKLHQEA